MAAPRAFQHAGFAEPGERHARAVGAGAQQLAGAHDFGGGKTLLGCRQQLEDDGTWFGRGFHAVFIQKIAENDNK